MAGIVQRDCHQQRLRRECIKQIRPVDPAGERRHDVLLSIVRRTWRFDIGLREVLGVAFGDNGDADAAVECRQELRHCPPARLAAATDPLRIDFRARQQVIDPADAVPGAEQTEVGAEQNEAASSVLVLASSAAADRRLAGPGSRVLNAFTLPERVVREDDVAFARKVREQLLIARPSLAIHRMAERPKNRWVTSCSRRHIEIHGDVESRPALKCQFLDSIARPLDDPRHARVEGRALEGSPEHLPELRDHHLLPVENLLPRGDRVDDSLPSPARIVCEADEVSLEIAGIIRERRAVDVQFHTRRPRLI